MAAPASDQAVASITGWARRGEWRPRLDHVVDAHFGPVLSAFDLPADDLPELLGDAFAPLLACVLEDFLARGSGPDQPSIITAYLELHGFRERAPVKAYLRALERSVMSVYQVVLAAPGSHLVLRDLIRGREAIWVDDRPGAASLAVADRIAVRLLPIAGRTYLSHGMLRLAAEGVSDLIMDITRLRRSYRRGLAREAEQRRTVARLEPMPLEDALLGELAPILTQTWLSASLEQRLGPGARIARPKRWPMSRLTGWSGSRIAAGGIRI